MSTEADMKQVSKALARQLVSNDPEQVKEAQVSLDEFTKTRLRETCVREQVIPTENLTYDELDRSLDSNKPIKIYDLEAESPGGQSVPFASSPEQHYIRTKKYAVVLGRQQTPRMQSDVAELGTLNFDVRQQLSDNMIKDLGTEDDRAWFALCDRIAGTANVANAITGDVQHTSYPALDRDSWVQAKYAMTRGVTRFSPETFVCNSSFVAGFERMDHDEIGGTMSQDLLVNGFSQRNFSGMKLIASIKREIIADGVVYFYPKPEFIGHAVALEDTTLSVKREDFMVAFYAYRMFGITVGNVGSIYKASFGVAAGAPTSRFPWFPAVA